MLFPGELSKISVFPWTYPEYFVPDRGRGIYKKITSQYPAQSPWGQKKRFFLADQGIYRKIMRQYPADRKKVDMERQFFCIYPV